MVRVNIPRLVARRIRGKTYWTWQPSRAVRALGFTQESFGTDRDRAICDAPGTLPLAPTPPSVSSRPSSKTLGIGAPKR